MPWSAPETVSASSTPRNINLSQHIIQVHLSAAIEDRDSFVTVTYRRNNQLREHQYLLRKSITVPEDPTGVRIQSVQISNPNTPVTIRYYHIDQPQNYAPAPAQPQPAYAAAPAHQYGQLPAAGGNRGGGQIMGQLPAQPQYDVVQPGQANGQPLHNYAQPGDPLQSGTYAQTHEPL